MVILEYSKAVGDFNGTNLAKVLRIAELSRDEVFGRTMDQFNEEIFREGSSRSLRKWIDLEMNTVELCKGQSSAALKIPIFRGSPQDRLVGELAQLQLRSGLQ